eukprot:gene19780-biopygen11141
MIPAHAATRTRPRLRIVVPVARARATAVGDFLCRLRIPCAEQRHGGSVTCSLTESHFMTEEAMLEWIAAVVPQVPKDVIARGDVAINSGFHREVRERLLAGKAKKEEVDRWVHDHGESQDNVLDVDEVVDVDAQAALFTETIKLDGHCLFRAFSIVSTGNQNAHERIRESICNYIEQNSADYAEFVPYNHVPAYVRRMRKNAEWGDHVCLQAFANRNRATLYVHFRSDPTRVIEPKDGPGGPTCRTPEF